MGGVIVICAGAAVRILAARRIRRARENRLSRQLALAALEDAMARAQDNDDEGWQP